MKTEMRRALARESFEEKIRKIGQLIQLSAAAKVRRHRQQEAAESPISPRKITIKQGVDSKL